MPWTDHYRNHLLGDVDAFQTRYASGPMLEELGAGPLDEARRILLRLTHLAPNGIGHGYRKWGIDPRPWVAISRVAAIGEPPDLDGDLRVVLWYHDGQHFIGLRNQNDDQQHVVPLRISQGKYGIHQDLLREVFQIQGRQVLPETQGGHTYFPVGPIDDGFPVGTLLEDGSAFARLLQVIDEHSYAQPNDVWTRYCAQQTRNPDGLLVPRGFVYLPPPVVNVLDDDPPPIIMQDLNSIIYGPPGTGKTHSVISVVLDAIASDAELEGIEHLAEYAGSVREGNVRERAQEADWHRWIDKYNKLVDAGRIEFTTFHQNYSYEDFIEGLRASTDRGGVTYNIECGVLKRIAYRALFAWITGNTPASKEMLPAEIAKVQGWMRDPDWTACGAKGSATPAYALVIDEINRGNVARIFGEIITLVEESKRACRAEDLSPGKQPVIATLPYSKEPFILPPNLYIIGTMNTADRSLIGLDAALRRRFDFIEMRPQPHLLQTIDEGGGVDLPKLLTEINMRIERYGNPEHAIGHAYLMGVTDMSKLAAAMRRKVIPQLREYFHWRPELIQRILSRSVDEAESPFVNEFGRPKPGDEPGVDPFMVHANYRAIYADIEGR